MNKQKLVIDEIMSQIPSYVLGTNPASRLYIEKLLRIAWLEGKEAGVEESLEEFKKWLG